MQLFKLASDFQVESILTIYPTLPRSIGAKRSGRLIKNLLFFANDFISLTFQGTIHLLLRRARGRRELECQPWGLQDVQLLLKHLVPETAPSTEKWLH